MTTVDVAVVGAGLAGLACARHLHQAGRDVVVLEAADAVGGRVRTDVVDGFRLDRGFQVLLTGYPELRRQVDLDALDLRRFSSGVTVRVGDRFRRLADPTREPRSLPSALQVIGPLDGPRLLRWRHHLLATPGAQLARAPQVSTAELLQRLGISTRLTEAFFRPFVAGTFFDPHLETSSRFTELVFRSFFRGDVAVPADGMQRLPEALAAGLPDDAVRLDTPVRQLDGTTLVTEDGAIEAGTVVVATEAPTAARLLGDAVGVATAHRSATTIHFAADDSPVGGPDLVLSGDRDGPVTTVAPMSEVAPSYAPAGRALLSVAVSGAPDTDDALDTLVRGQLRRWWGAAVDRWERLRVDRIAYAQPRMNPVDLPDLRRPVRVGHGRWVCGDHRDTASLQGALVSGRRTAEQVLRA